MGYWSESAKFFNQVFMQEFPQLCSLSIVVSPKFHRNLCAVASCCIFLSHSHVSFRAYGCAFMF
jgi:hypothetical protein